MSVYAQIKEVQVHVRVLHRFLVTFSFVDLQNNASFSSYALIVLLTWNAFSEECIRSKSRLWSVAILYL